MATTVEGLFNLPTQQQAGQQYYEGLLTSPGQMNNLTLLQQLSALGANAGAGVGYAGGRLLGGKAPDEVRIQGVNEAMAEATRMGGTDAEMYANLARGLAARGLTQDAMAATERARTAKRDEQAMTLAASQEQRAVSGEARAVSGEGRAVSAEQRALLEEERRVIAAKQAEAEYKQRMAMYPLDVQAKGLAIQKAEQDLRGAMGEYSITQDALTKGINPKTGQPLTDTEARELRARLAQATLAINAEATKVAQDKAEHELKMKSYEASIASSKASAANSRNNAAFKYDATIQVPSLIPTERPINLKVGRMNSMGEVIGNDGQPYPNVNAAAQAQNIGGAGVPAGNASATAAAPAAEKKAEPEASLLTNFLTNQPQANTPAQSPAFIIQLQKETDELMLGKRKAYSPSVQAYLDKTQGTKAENKAKQDAYKRQEQERMLRGNR